jgi:peptidoglycan/xylan/chitin deacetylase (PgdA/CDA1 family)
MLRDGSRRERLMAGWRGSGAAVAVFSFDVDAESPVLASGRRFAGHAMAMTHQAFGPLHGVPRLLRLLDEYHLPATFFIPGLTADRYPAMVEEVLSRGHEVAHHSYSHRSPTSLSPDEERRDFEQALEALARCGVEPKGHRAALWEATWQTPELVAEHGMEYDSSLMDADVPYLLETGSGTIAELPPHWGLDDWEQYAYLPQPHLGSVIQSPRIVAEMWIHELDAMRRHGCLFLLTCHPFLSGRAGRTEALRMLIEAVLDRGDVEVTTCLDLARRVQNDAEAIRRVLEPVTASPETYPQL